MMAGAVLLLTLVACNDKKPTQPTSGTGTPSVVGAWTDGVISVVVNQNYTWQASGELRWSCSVNGVAATCSHQLSVTGAVQGGSTYSISGTTTSGSGTTDYVTGSWDAGVTRLSGTATTSAGASRSFSLTKAG